MNAAVKQSWQERDLKGLRLPKRVSAESKWDDLSWTFDHPNRDTAPANRRIVWNIELPDGSNLGDLKHRHLLDTVKAFTWSMHVSPPNGRQPQKFTTLMKTGDYALILVKWMIGAGIYRFSQLRRDLVREYVAAISERPGRNGKKVGSYTVGCIALVVEYIYQQRQFLKDRIPEAPFLPGETPADLMRRRTIVPYERIPDDLACELYSIAEKWVRSGLVLSKFYFRYQRTLARVRLSQKFPGIRSKRTRLDRQCKLAWEAVAAHAPTNDLPPNCPELNNRFNVALAMDLLIAASYIVIALLTGMRVSEQLSMKRGCVSSKIHRKSKRRYHYVESRQHKIRGSREGVVMRWVAPQVVKLAVQCLDDATRTHREETGFDELFLTRQGIGGKPFAIEKRRIDHRINQFARLNQVGVGQASTRRILSHQFRKTFARFVARRDHTGLVALSMHLKHVSLAMTDESYVGTDYALEELIDEAIEEAIFDVARSITSGEPLAGKMGQRISKKLVFLGRAGNQTRKGYAKFLLEESAITVIPEAFSDCLFFEETALCGGKMERRGLSTCLNCSNMLVRPAHRGFWEDYVKRCKALLRASRSALAAAPIRRRLKAAQAIVRDLESKGRWPAT